MLALSTKGRYAARIMLRLAQEQSGEPLRVQDIAASEGIAPAYIEQILIVLKTAGLVRSHRGAKGGFSLALDPGTISVGRVLAATEGPVCLVPCLGDVQCPRAPKCPTQPLWRQANSALTQAFEGITIGQMAMASCPSATPAAFGYEI